MEINKIPLIIPVFNQLTYLKNLINWFRWYYPENPIHILDNGSTYKPLLEFYEKTEKNIIVTMCWSNLFIENLKWFLGSFNGYYIISDPDIMPHPSTPPNFLEAFKKAIDVHGYHRAGFGLDIDDLPLWLNERAMILGNENELLRNMVSFEFDGSVYNSYKAPLDTTFCLYKRDNGGWSSPMNGEDWGNCLRLFKAYHFGWFQHPKFINEEMDYYFKHAKYRVPGEPSAGKNNNRPEQYK